MLNLRHQYAANVANDGKGEPSQISAGIPGVAVAVRMCGGGRGRGPARPLLVFPRGPTRRRRQRRRRRRPQRQLALLRVRRLRRRRRRRRMNVTEVGTAAVVAVRRATLPKVPLRSRGADHRNHVVIAAVERLQLVRVEERLSHLNHRRQCLFMLLNMGLKRCHNILQQ